METTAAVVAAEIGLPMVTPQADHTTIVLLPRCQIAFRSTKTLGRTQRTPVVGQQEQQSKSVNVLNARDALTMNSVVAMNLAPLLSSLSVFYVSGG